MYDQRFFASKLGLAALISISAMLSFNIYAFAQAQGMPAGSLSTLAAHATVLA